jgi:hypothetical protein
MLFQPSHPSASTKMLPTTRVCNMIAGVSERGDIGGYWQTNLNLKNDLVRG